MQKGSAVRHSKGYPAGVVISNAVKYFILVFFAFWTLIPLVSCLITAFKTDAEYQSTSVMMLPTSRTSPRLSPLRTWEGHS